MLGKRSGARRSGRLKRGAIRGRAVAGVASVAVAAACGGGSGPPTFAGDVAPILHARCAGCHRPEGPAPIDLLTYEDAVTSADAIAAAVESGRMPPWLPAPGDVAFAGDRSLTASERSALLEWARSEAHPTGDLSAVEAPRFAGGWRLGEPDLVARTETAYPVPTTGGDRFRNLVIRAPVTGRVWVRGLELRFNDASVVHHAMITFDRTSSSRRMDARDAEPGFDGMFASTEALGPSGFLLGWTPGREPALSPMGLAFPLDPGTDIVLQLHLRPTGEPVELEAEIGIHTADDPPERTPFTVRLGLQEIDIAAGDTYVGTDAYTLPVAVEVLGIYPHAHYLGREIALTAVTPDSGALELLDIPSWNFNWQDAYRLAEPLRLAAGTRLEGRFVYDNTTDNPLNPNRPPRRVLYGPRSEDEMGEIWIQVVPVEGDDLEALQTDFAREDIASKIAGWRHTLATRGDEPVAHVGLGTVAQARGRTDEAIAHFRAALAEEPDYVVARYNLALALESSGDLAGAVREYERTVRDDPAHAAAHNNLGLIAARDGRLAEAVRHFEAAVAAEPSFPEARNNLGNAYRQRGDLDRAGEELARALELDPDYEAARLNLALVAWTRATHPDAANRDAGAAVRWAERAAGNGGRGDPRILDVLAAAYAEAGRFEDAVETGTEAVRVARAAGPQAAALVRAIEARVRGYREGRPHRSG